MEPVNVFSVHTATPSKLAQINVEQPWNILTKESTSAIVPLGRVLKQTGNIAEPLMRSFEHISEIPAEGSSPFVRGLKSFWSIAIPVATISALFAGGIEVASSVAQVSYLACAMTLGIAMSLRPGQGEAHTKERAYLSADRSH